jgi:hypothetical protein
MIDMHLVISHVRPICIHYKISLSIPDAMNGRKSAKKSKEKKIRPLPDTTIIQHAKEQFPNAGLNERRSDASQI